MFHLGVAFVRSGTESLISLHFSEVLDEPIAANPPPEPLPLTAELVALQVNNAAAVEEDSVQVNGAAVAESVAGLHLGAKDEIEPRKEPEKEMLPLGTTP